eukprot:TRINITY_DN24889_c0_g1_i1.p1 TRINITY_DN24889_c0_g1~~TRINITY_DN24889_c0_g1_i1.p1  ORF type:complete len:523 (+),score=82.32 TRINITY_DN24889_c0_g1_i1:72-1640(+)
MNGYPKGRGKGGKGKQHAGTQGRTLDVACSYWGKIIGKNGETLKQLQEQFGVKIFIPRPDSAPGSMPTLFGPAEACEACEVRIMEILKSMQRGKTKPQKPKTKCDGMVRTCTLCDAQSSSVATTFGHLGTVRHMSAVGTRLPDTIISSRLPMDIEGVLDFLQVPEVRQLHIELGYDVDALLEEGPRIQAQAMARKAMMSQMSLLTADQEWIIVENRWCCRWDDSITHATKPLPMMKAPKLEELCERCFLDELPPTIRVPGLPAPLPCVDPKFRKANVMKGQHRFPLDPTGVRLGIAACHLRGLGLEGFDVICGTSFLKALSGDAARVKDAYYLQRFRKTCCVLHVPSAFHNPDDAGHAVEMLLCGSQHEGSFYACSTLRVGDSRLLVTSEIDASTSDGDIVELKSSSTKNLGSITNAASNLQVAVNGSAYVLACGLDKDKTQLTKTSWLSAEAIRQAHNASFINQGQSVRFFLTQVLSHEFLQAGTDLEEVGPILKLTFDEVKAPVINATSEEVEVLPRGLL